MSGSGLSGAKLNRRVRFTFDWKKYLLLASIFVAIFANTGLRLFDDLRAREGAADRNSFTAAAMFGSALLITLSNSKKKVFHNRGITIFIAGIFAWLFYVFIAFVTRTLIYDTLEYKELLGLLVFSVTVILLARIIVMYDWKEEVITTVCLALGISLVTAYIMYRSELNTDSLVANLGSIFNNSGRYIFAFGFGKNFIGRISWTFFMMACIYRAVREEKNKRPGKTDKFNAFFLVPISFIAALTLISSASRASITGTMLFFMTYSYLTYRSKISKSFRTLITVFTIIIAAVIVLLVDWNYVIRESGRLSNYASLDGLIRYDAWVSGMSFFMNKGEMYVITRDVSIDNYYLWTFLRLGLVGFVIYIGTILWLFVIYIHDAENMTKLYRYVGALFVAYLYYGMFEQSLFGRGLVEMVLWSLILVELNQKPPKAGMLIKPCKTAHSHIA